MDLTELARDSKYVSITTFRADGTPRPTPVWIADLGDGTAGFTTGLESYKVKRLANTTDVELRPCDLRGNVADDAPVVLATGRVDTGADLERVRAAIKSKYGVMHTLIVRWEQLKGLVKRSADGDGTCAIVIAPRA